ncbi:MAG: dihydrolipoyl dehydrogenase [Elusimicrobiota bacterium]
MKNFDYVIIGGGPAGCKAAMRLADKGGTVCIIEERENGMGGTCLNEGCIPVKSILHIASTFSRMKEFTDNRHIDAERIAVRVKENTATLRNGLLFTLKNKGIVIIPGRASFINDNTVEINCPDGSERISAKAFLIATGSLPRKLTGVKYSARILDSKSMLDSFYIPDDILIIGGGYIGCEFASLFSLLGTKVTLMETCSSILPGEDADISKALSRSFKKQSIRMITGAEVSYVSDNGNGVSISYTKKAFVKPETVSFGTVLVSVGRVPFSTGLGLDNAGIDTENGFIRTDDNMQTARSNIYAAGDVINSVMFAHAAYREAMNAALSMSGETCMPVDYSKVPRIVFTSPQTAATGITAEEAGDKGIDVRCYKAFFKANARAVISQQTDGFLKLVFESKYGRLIGASAVGPEVSELIHTLNLAVSKGLTQEDLQNTVFGHPTYSEIIQDTLT